MPQSPSPPDESLKCRKSPAAKLGPVLYLWGERHSLSYRSLIRKGSIFTFHSRNSFLHIKSINAPGPFPSSVCVLQAVGIVCLNNHQSAWILADRNIWLRKVACKPFTLPPNTLSTPLYASQNSERVVSLCAHTQLCKNLCWTEIT